ncbi:MAG: hypothetical protein HC925_06235 [Coleofasciculaceae cyanobacterium SM2_3_26]|nr:hypothetical protein [Coleofasciculaceae cyanobacterium SM2_3_26]
MKQILHGYRYHLLAGLTALLLWLATTMPSTAHWADLATAEIAIAGTEVQVTLTIPRDSPPLPMAIATDSFPRKKWAIGQRRCRHSSQNAFK